jgi:signal peptidase I
MADRDEQKKSTVREYYEALLIAVIFVNFARIFVFQAFKIPTPSMVDNLLIGDHIIVNKFIYGPSGSTLFQKILAFRDLRRGDIVVFRFPEDPTTDFVKRVIGMPGDEVFIHDKQVYVNNVPLQEPYVVHDDAVIIPPTHPELPEPYRSRDQFGPYHVPPGKYFVMGDNRDRSNDSRYWGPVKRELIKGRAFVIYWSFHGVPADPRAATSDRIRELADVVIHFFPRTRWDRTFMIVDSKYHYHPEPDLGPTPSE